MANQPINNPKEFNDVLRLLETTDLGHSDTFNPLFRILINNDAFLKAVTDTLSQEVSGIQGDLASDYLHVGTDNKSVQETKNLLIDVDTRSVVITRDAGQIASIAVKDSVDNSTIETLSITRTDGQITAASRIVNGKTITYNINRIGGQITSITKGVA